MKWSLRNAMSSYPQLRHWLVILAVILVLIVTLFAWNSAAEGGTVSDQFPAFNTSPI